MSAIEPDDYADIREAVAKLCAQFPVEYWRKLDREMAYPQAFVDALTEAGYLSVLIPEEYGGAGLKLSAAAAILEEIQRAGCNGGGCHAQMYTMATLLRHGSEEQKAKWLTKIASGELRLQAFGVTEPTSGTDTSSLKTFARRDGNNGYIVNGQKIWTSRAEYSDLMLLLARTTPKEQSKKRTDGLSVFIVDMRAAKNNGLSISPIRTMMNHSTTEVFFTDLRVPAENLVGQAGKGFRYILSGTNDLARLRSYRESYMLPLEELLVVAVEQAVAVPYCMSRLGDAGARVIKVERPEGDFARGYDAAEKGQSIYFVWLNRGKDSVVS